jgi:hypothetical protein
MVACSARAAWSGWGGVVVGEVGVEGLGEGVVVGDGPVGADDVVVASQVEGGGEVGGFVGMAWGGVGGVAGRQVGQARFGELQCGDVGEGQGVGVVVVQDESAGGGVGPVD